MNGMHGREVKGDRRRFERSGIFRITVEIKDAFGCRIQGAVINVSVMGIAILMESFSFCTRLEIRPTKSSDWIELAVQNVRSCRSGYIVGCTFNQPVTDPVANALFASIQRRLSG
jgi:hypothetical protein